MQRDAPPSSVNRTDTIGVVHRQIALVGFLLVEAIDRLPGLPQEVVDNLLQARLAPAHLREIGDQRLLVPPRL